jgi:hypothetical protein
MGSFEDHMRYGIGAYLAVVFLLAAPVGYLVYNGYVGGMSVALAVGAAVGGFPFAVAGAGFPDIDHHAAKPHRFFKKWVSVIASVVGGYAFYASGVAVKTGGATVEALEAAPGLPEPFVGVAFATAGGVAAGGLVFVAVGVLKPRHRGVTHTLGAGFFVAGLIGVAAGYAAAVVFPSAAVFAGGIAATGFFVGFLSHLQCDGLLFRFLPDAMG